MSSTLAASAHTVPPRKFIAWLPTVAWVAMIACFSTDSFSSAHTGSILLRLIHSIYGPITERQFDVINVFIRKGAHFTVYGVLSWLAYNSWRATFPSPRPWQFNWSGLALALTLVAASADEFHQSFVPSRTSSPLDVLLDVTGAIFFQTLIASFAKGYSTRRGRSAH